MSIRRIAEIAVFICGIIIGVAYASAMSAGASPQETKHDTIYIDRMLSDWEILSMAIAETESDYDPRAWNEQSNAVGYMQITPIFLAEYNRLWSDTIKMEDCFDPDINLRVYQRVNQILNADFDIERAIYLHNPLAGEWYRTRVYNKMDDILRMEQARYRVTQICNDR